MVVLLSLSILQEESDKETLSLPISSSCVWRYRVFFSKDKCDSSLWDPVKAARGRLAFSQVYFCG